MADSTTTLDTVSQSVSQREVQINALFDAASPSTIFGRRSSTCSGLVFGYYGGRLNGTSVANGTVTAAASNTNYVVAHRATLAVTVSTSNTNWNDTATYGRMYKLTAGGSSVTAYEDHRAGDGGILQAAVVVGDSGSGGTKGLVPAPGAGDAAAGKFLKADGTFAVPPGGASALTTKGDLLTYDSDVAALSVGTDGYVLTADSGEATGIKWAAPTGGGSGNAIAMAIIFGGG